MGMNATVYIYSKTVTKLFSPDDKRAPTVRGTSAGDSAGGDVIFVALVCVL